MVPNRPRGRARSSARGARGADRSPRPLEPLALCWAATCAALLLLAPAESNWFWSLNGFRSLPLDGRIALLLVASATALLPALRTRSRLAWSALAVLFGALLAFPLREKIHFLGDTETRIGAIAALGAHLVSTSFADWSQRLHANPLDVLLNLMLPAGLERMGLSVIQSVSVTSLLLALAFFAGVWRASSRLGAPAEVRLALCGALALSGSLETFAGYAESAGLMMTAAVWWLAELVAPIARPRDAARLALAWLVLFLSHRIALVMLAPQLLRALGPAVAGDRPDGRRWLLPLTAGALVLGFAGLLAGLGAHQLQVDVQDALSALLSRAGGTPLPPSDALNALALVAPLGFLAPAFAGRHALAALVRRVEIWPLMLAAALLIPLTWLLATAPHGLGAHRDWDLSALLGLTLTMLSGALLAQLPPDGLRASLRVMLPVVALLAGSWVALNAHESASVKRVLALASKPPPLADAQQSALHTYLGQRAMNLSQPQMAGRYYERAFDLVSNPRIALESAEAWAMSRDPADARRMLARARARPLNAELEAAARAIEDMVAHLEADSTAARLDSTSARFR